MKMLLKMSQIKSRQNFKIEVDFKKKMSEKVQKQNLVLKKRSFLDLTFSEIRGSVENILNYC